MEIANNITELTGNTPLVRLNKFAENLVGKIESFNPMASIKDRISVSMIEEAEKKGLINEQTTIIEPTSGNTGIGLAFTCASKNYKLVLTMPESMSEERRALLKSFGADLVLTSSDKGMNGAIEKAKKLGDNRENTFIPQQFKNLANPKAHKNTTGPEIWEATDGEIDIFVSGVGTGGTITGVSEYIKEKKGKNDFKSIAVEPDGSPVLSGGDPGSHSIQGIGAGFIPDILRTELIDEVLKVNEKESKDMAHQLAQKEGILAGISSGAALSAAVEVAKRPKNRGSLIVVILPDTGERYLSTELYKT